MGVSAWRKKIPRLAVLSWVGLLLAASIPVRAGRLPIKVYTTADGLAQNPVNRIARDLRGFLWSCTGDGLSHKE